MNYWKELTNRKNAIVYGPVFDPRGIYGMTIIEVNSEQQADAIAKGDPAVLSKICTCELIPMRMEMTR